MTDFTMTTDALTPMPPDACAQFDAQLGPWLERDLDATADAWMAQHRALCAHCDALARDLEQLVAEANALPPVSPPRDLWHGIEARLEAPVIPIDAGLRVAPAAATSGRTITLRRFALAATLLVAVSSGVTWQLAQRGRPTDAVVADGPVTEAPFAGPDATPQAQWVSDDEVPNAGVTFEREIVALRQIVDERFAELDTTTVQELRRNLAIIDRAIADSQAALARDPRSGLLSSQLDRALQAKLDLLRRVALL